jgi:hypothetical protein
MITFAAPCVRVCVAPDFANVAPSLVTGFVSPAGRVRVLGAVSRTVSITRQSEGRRRILVSTFVRSISRSQDRADFAVPRPRRRAPDVSGVLVARTSGLNHAARRLATGVVRFLRLTFESTEYSYGALRARIVRKHAQKNFAGARGRFRFKDLGADFERTLEAWAHAQHDARDAGAARRKRATKNANADFVCRNAGGEELRRRAS